MRLHGKGWVQAMRRGDHEAAWAHDAAVLAGRDPATRDDPSVPYHLRWVWDGRPMEGAHVLVRCYHGLGDTIQFARYLPHLRRIAASVTVEAPPRLLPLLEGFPGVDRLIPFDPAAPAPPSECDIEIMELAFALRHPPAAAPPPYLKAPPALLPDGTIGLCWEAGDWDETRSIPGALFRPLTSHPCVTLVGAPSDLPVLNPDGCPMDMEITAALIAGVDLLITVDTMVAHLAGALGTPVWLLLKHDPDWRWPDEKGASCGWYPSMRFFRQTRAGDWGEVMERVSDDLAGLEGARKRRLGAG